MFLLPTPLVCSQINGKLNLFCNYKNQIKLGCETNFQENNLKGSKKRKLIKRKANKTALSSFVVRNSLEIF